MESPHGRRAGGRAGRVALRATQHEQVERLPFLTRTFKPFEILNEEGLSIIEENADTILQEVGLEFRGDADALRLFREAGADVTFVEAPRTPDEIAGIGRLPWPQLVNIVLGGRTPELPNARLKELSFAGVIYANIALQAALHGMQHALGELRKNGQVGDAGVFAVGFAERQRLVGKPEFDALERKYKV